MPTDDKDLADIAAEGYIYLYPLITMELTRRQATNVAPDTMPGRGPMNRFSHIRAFPAADFKMVVRPNFDTLYSSGWLDLREGPVVVSAPDTDGRYYMLPMLDMWTDVFASPGKRTSGTAASSWAVVPPGWEGTLPEGVERIDAPTPVVWIIGRTQTNGAHDYDAVHQVQDGYALRRLSPSSTDDASVEVDPDVDMVTAPLDLVNAMSGREYFALGARLMKIHPPHVTDWSVTSRMRRLGFVPGEDFDPTGLEPTVAAAIDAAPRAAQAALTAQLATMATVKNGWQMNVNAIGVYGNFYAKRAIVAMVGLGANPPEDAVYPLLMSDGDGEHVDGSRDYVLHFEHDSLPPVDAFWSVTMYDEHGFQVANEIDRFAIGDRDALRYNDDGSLDLFIQHANPGPEKTSNWLPAPQGPLGITMRLYAPRASILSGEWSPPPLQRVPR